MGREDSSCFVERGNIEDRVYCVFRGWVWGVSVLVGVVVGYYCDFRMEVGLVWRFVKIFGV